MHILFKLLKNIEFLFWIIALIYLSIIDVNGTHFSFCLFKFIGFKKCIGCGLGLSIANILHGNFKTSFKIHYLGFFALTIILFRIYTIIKNTINFTHKLN